MPADRLLNTLLQHYQDVHDAAKTEQIIGTTVHLLAELSNPLNLGVLTSQLLTAPAIWLHADGLRTSLRILSIYNTAATRVRTHEDEKRRRKELRETGGSSTGLRFEAWARAVVKGADDRSRRWQHLLVLTGVLSGMGDDQSSSLRTTLEQAVATAANLALATQIEDGPVAAASVVLALNFAFPLLSDFHKSQINCDALLPLAVWCFTGEHGFQQCQFLQAIEHDTMEMPGGVLAWHAHAPSFQILKETDQAPLMAGIGPLSKLVGFAAQQATDPARVLQAQDALLEFTGKALEQWRRSKLAAVDPGLVGSRLSQETLQTTYPILLGLFRKLMYGLVAIIQAIVARSLVDPKLLGGSITLNMAAKTLHMLRNIFFISSHDGNSSFQAYAFVYLTSIDILTRDSESSETFLRVSQPFDITTVPHAHIQRCLDLFYLNLAENLTLTLSTETCDALIVRPAMVYLGHNGPMSPFMVELFESAHSAILSVLSCPQHSQLTIKMAPFYIVKLFESFPHRISSRQFRVAFKTVMQIVSPPFPIAAMEPQLSETLLEMLRAYMATASIETLPATPDSVSRSTAGQQSQDGPLSAQSSLALALIDSLPFLPLPLVEEWLTIAGQALNEIADPRLREPVKRRFWDVLVSGEMDVERAAIGVGWWGTKGGRELVLSGGAELPMMSGALVREEEQSRL